MLHDPRQSSPVRKINVLVGNGLQSGRKQEDTSNVTMLTLETWPSCCQLAQCGNIMERAQYLSTVPSLQALFATCVRQWTRPSGSYPCLQLFPWWSMFTAHDNHGATSSHLDWIGTRSSCWHSNRHLNSSVRKAAVNTLVSLLWLQARKKCSCSQASYQHSHSSHLEML
jgi:hypothetical protein